LEAWVVLYLERFVFGTFCSWDLMSWNILSWDVLYVHRSFMLDGGGTPPCKDDICSVRPTKRSHGCTLGSVLSVC
jgi:hypothetical protein